MQITVNKTGRDECHHWLDNGLLIGFTRLKKGRIDSHNQYSFTDPNKASTVVIFRTKSLNK